MQLGGERGFLGHRQIRRAGGNDEDRAAADVGRVRRRRAGTPGARRPPRSAPGSAAVTAAASVRGQPRDQHALTAVAQAARDGDDLLRRLAGARAPPPAARCAGRDGGRPWRSRGPRTAAASPARTPPRRRARRAPPARGCGAGGPASSPPPRAKWSWPAALSGTAPPSRVDHLDAVAAPGGTRRCT